MGLISISKNIRKLLGHTAKNLKKHPILTGAGLGIVGTSAVNYAIDDGHDKLDHGRKKYAFASHSKEGVTWTNRSKKDVESYLNTLEKSIGKKGKISYYASQDPKTHGSTKHMGKNPVDTVKNVRKKIFKKWDSSKVSFGHLYKAAMYEVAHLRFGKGDKSSSVIVDPKTFDKIYSGYTNRGYKLTEKGIIGRGKNRKGAMKSLFSNLSSHTDDVIKKLEKLYPKEKTAETMTKMEKADQKYAIAKSYEREGHPRKANEYKSKASRAYKRALEKKAGMQYILPSNYMGKEWAKYPLKGKDTTDILVVKDKHKHLLFEASGKNLSEQIKNAYKKIPKGDILILKSSPRKYLEKKGSLVEELKDITGSSNYTMVKVNNKIQPYFVARDKKHGKKFYKYMKKPYFIKGEKGILPGQGISTSSKGYISDHKNKSKYI